MMNAFICKQGRLLSLSRSVSVNIQGENACKAPSMYPDPSGALDP